MFAIHNAFFAYYNITMDIQWFKDLGSLADTGNFSQAAVLNNISQSAFSRRIRACGQETRPRSRGELGMVRKHPLGASLVWSESTAARHVVPGSSDLLRPIEDGANS